MITIAVAKINLGLNVVEKRPDGYHNLQTVFYPVPIKDVLEVVPMSEDAHSDMDCDLTVTNIPIEGDIRRNLVVRAYDLLKQDFPTLPRVRVRLEKNIPTQAGMGGGSSDCAYRIRVLNALFGVNLSAAQMASYAAQLGADCAFFVYAAPCYAEGIGEKLQALSIPGSVYVLMAKPPVAVSTKEVYQAYDKLLEEDPPELADIEKVKSAIEKGDAPALASCLYNALALVTEPLHPEIVHLREEILKEGAKGALMSGSGPSVFGLYDDLAAAQAAADRLQERFPDVFFAAVPFCYNHKELD